jgi:hypothetical protein
MRRVRSVCEKIRNLERAGRAQKGGPLAGVVAAVLALIGVEILLVLWLYELPARPSPFRMAPGYLKLAEPSILLTHPRGPLCLLLLMVGVAIATVCRDVAQLTHDRAKESQQPRVELQRTARHAYVLAGFTAAMALVLKWGG